jgi:NADPH-dependent 2,4-dienoyl-CoA reductase/sulfur reductase-like enzyme
VLNSFKYAILGGGAAGGYAARQLVEEGAKPGDIVLISSDTMLPYTRPALSKGFLAGKKDADDLLINPATFYEDHGIDVRLNAFGSRLDAEKSVLLLKSGTAIHYEKLLIATGSNVRTFSGKGAQNAEIYYLRLIDDARALRTKSRQTKHPLIIGGGFIGMEVAAVLAGRHDAVQIIFPEKQFMKRMMTERMYAFYRDYYEQHGVTVRSQESVEQLSSDGSTIALRLTSGSVVEGDMVVAGIGVLPAVELLDPARIALSNGIVVNEYLETSSPNVYAAGDVAYFPDVRYGKRRHVEHWQNAVDQGKVAARNMAGRREPYTNAPYFFSDIFDLSWEYWGDVADTDEVVHAGDMRTGAFSVWWLKNGHVHAAFAQGRPDDERELAKKSVDELGPLPDAIRKQQV